MGGLLLAPHSTLCDLALLAPVAILAVASGGLIRYPGLLLMSPLPSVIWDGAGVWTVLMMVLLLLVWRATAREDATRLVTRAYPAMPASPSDIAPAAP
jgi:hypothetical protein